MKMRNSWDDVVLTNSTSYMVTDENYKEHLEKVKESKDRLTCSNHQVINQAKANWHNLEAIGIKAITCV
ncbi:hypothetical protein EW146_g4405 [Bondarzewia mesenterica]|uniref:Uncharacterized protein n=1 Tax=Bondarzewia mesenterica TaxID=1095465 RepID=A0A4V3XF50_9AGAM|nr:hypothetical protein EW146_g4405 [Bondarzewia mesenterica]